MDNTPTSCILFFPSNCTEMFRTFHAIGISDHYQKYNNWEIHSIKCGGEGKTLEPIPVLVNVEGKDTERKREKEREKEIE